MLDAEKKLVFDILHNLIGEDGNYKVIEADEILEKLPNTTQMNKVQLSAIIRELRDTEFIRVKYFTPDEYCMLTLKHPGLVPLGEEEPVVKPEPQSKSVTVVQNVAPKKLNIMVLLFSFFGGIIGGGVVAAVAIILQKFLF